MDEGRITKGDAGKKKRTRLLTVGSVAAVVVLIVMVGVLSGAVNIAGTASEDKIITKSNESLILGLNELPPGWIVNVSYRPDPERGGQNITEVGAARYNNTSSLAPFRAEFITIIIYRMNSTEAAKDLLTQWPADRTVVNYMGEDIVIVGNESIGDESTLYIGNWTYSHAAIKFLVFRENNIIINLVYEATENLNLSNEVVIELGNKQDAKLLS